IQYGATIQEIDRRSLLLQCVLEFRQINPAPEPLPETPTLHLDLSPEEFQDVLETLELQDLLEEAQDNRKRSRADVDVIEIDIEEPSEAREPSRKKQKLDNHVYETPSEDALTNADVRRSTDGPSVEYVLIHDDDDSEILTVFTEGRQEGDITSYDDDDNSPTGSQIFTPEMLQAAIRGITATFFYEHSKQHIY
ncbi:MAG TPA: hypothetical protein DIU37_05035, partial [Opitutae bacterium]|nr:hypothetical protein [Opitutae bacterium]